MGVCFQVLQVGRGRMKLDLTWGLFIELLEVQSWDLVGLQWEEKHLRPVLQHGLPG